MVESPIIRTVDAEVAIRRIQRFTIIWMAIEVAVAFIAAIRAHSVALAAFGGDSAIELMSAAVVLARFRSPRRITEQFASKITGWLLVALAGYITAQSLYTLIAAESKPEPSYVGIGLLCAAALVMPWLGRRKRQLAITTKSSALEADAAQSSLCAYLSWIALARQTSPGRSSTLRNGVSFLPLVLLRCALLCRMSETQMLRPEPESWRTLLDSP